MGDDKADKPKGASDAEIRDHVLKKLKDALPKIREAAAKKKGAGDQ